VGASADEVKAARGELASEKEARKVLHCSVMERLDYLEHFLKQSADSQSQALEALLHDHVRDLRDGHAKELAATQGKLREEFHKGLEEEREEREKHHSRASEQLNREKEARCAHAERVSGLERKLDDDLAAVREHLASDRKAREAHERHMQNHAGGEKQAREAHEALIQSHLENEKLAREKHHEHVHGQMSQVAEAREALFQHQERLGKERAARDADRQHLEELIAEQQRQIQVIVAQEKTARSNIEELFSQDRIEAGKRQHAVTARVESLQRTLDIFDSLVRREISDRSEETGQLRRALDRLLVKQGLPAEFGEEAVCSSGGSACTRDVNPEPAPATGDGGVGDGGAARDPEAPAPPSWSERRAADERAADRAAAAVWAAPSWGAPPGRPVAAAVRVMTGSATVPASPVRVTAGSATVPAGAATPPMPRSNDLAASPPMPRPLAPATAPGGAAVVASGSYSAPPSAPLAYQRPTAVTTGYCTPPPPPPQPALPVPSGNGRYAAALAAFSKAASTYAASPSPERRAPTAVTRAVSVSRSFSASPLPGPSAAASVPGSGAGSFCATPPTAGPARPPASFGCSLSTSPPARGSSLSLSPDNAGEDLWAAAPSGHVTGGYGLSGAFEAEGEPLAPALAPALVPPLSLHQSQGLGAGLGPGLRMSSPALFRASS